MVETERSSVWFWFAVGGALGLIVYVLVSALIAAAWPAKRKEDSDKGLAPSAKAGGTSGTRKAGKKRKIVPAVVATANRKAAEKSEGGEGTKKSVESSEEVVVGGSKRRSTGGESEITKKARRWVSIEDDSSVTSDDGDDEENGVAAAAAADVSAKKTPTITPRSPKSSETNPFIPQNEDGWQTVLPRRRKQGSAERHQRGA